MVGPLPSFGDEHLKLLLLELQGLQNTGITGRILLQALLHTSSP
jgi:hypothetical protein